MKSSSVLALAPAAPQLCDQKGVLLHGPDGFGHRYVVGHQVVGEQVAEKLCEIAATAN